MRIVCQKCSAAYAIDDKFVTPKGVRAQCPRCRHLQLVKKDEGGGAAADPSASGTNPGAPSPFLFDMGGPGAAPPPASGSSGLHFGQTAPTAPPGTSPFDFAAPTSPGAGPAPSPFDFVSPPPAAPPASAQRAPAAAPSPFDFGAPPPPAPTRAPAAPSPFDFGAPPAAPARAAAAPSPFDFGAPPPEPEASPFDFAAAAPGPSGAAAENPFDFGAPPGAATSSSSSPFGDGGLDLGAPVPPPAAPAARASTPRPPPPPPPSFPGRPPNASAQAATDRAQIVGVKCRTCGKEMTDPFDQALGVCDECRNKTAEAASNDSPFPSQAPAMPAAPRAVPLFPSASTPISAGELTNFRGAMREDSGRGLGRGKSVGIAVGVVAVLAIGAVLAVKKPWNTKPPPLVVKPSGGTGGARPVESIVQQWRMKYPDLEGASASQLVDEGEGLLAKDTTLSYLDAEESFEQALVLDPSNDRALAGWVLALAFGKPGKIDEPTAKGAESMLAASEQRSGDLRVFVAHSHFLIARNGNPNDIKVLAERGLNSQSANDKALAALAIGQTVLTKNPQQAAQSFREALAIDPKLKRAYFFQAQLAAIQGNYKEATRALERRLELDADQWEAAEELARLLLDVGEVAKAKKVLESAKAAAPRAGRPRLGLAILAYQHLGDLPGASADLTALIDDPEIAKGDKADALVHLAAIQRMQGDLDKAMTSIEGALEFNADSTPARLQKFLILLDKGVASSARMELDGLKGKLGDKYLEATLEGRLLISENRLDDAIQTLASTAEADPRRVDAIFLAGAAAAKAKKAGKAWEFCLRRGLRADPNTRPVPSLTPLYVRPADLLKVAVGAYAGLVADADEDPSPALCEGLVAWFSEDLAAADKDMLKVTAIDAKNADAYAYRAMIATRRKDAGGALKLAARGIDATKTNANSWFAQAQAYVAANKIDLGKVSAQQAQRLAPQLLGPRVIVGDAEAGQKNGEEARRILTSVLLTDPLYRDAKRVLYKHQL